MQKVLIVAADQNLGESFQQTFGQYGFQTAVVWSPGQMVDFCRQHVPDITVIDLSLSSQDLWNSIQAVRSLGTMANVPFVGLSDGNAEELQAAHQAGFATAFQKKDGAGTAAEAIQKYFQQNQEPTSAVQQTAASPVGADRSEGTTMTEPSQPSAQGSSLNRLRAIAGETSSIASSLKPRVAEYGEDGAELFGYIENSSGQINSKLDEIGAEDLHDHELRHDFRNMIGSVTGFSELILMEPGLSPESQGGLTRLRELSSEFVDLLDQQKAMAST